MNVTVNISFPDALLEEAGLSEADIESEIAVVQNEKRAD